MSLTTEMLLSKAKVLENCTETMAKFINDQEGLNDTIIQGTDKQKQSAKDVIKLLNSTRSAIEAEEARGGDPSLVQNLTGLTEKLCDLANDFLRASEEENGDAVPSLKERKNIFMKENTKMITQLIAHANVPSIHKRGPGMMKQAAAMKNKFWLENLKMMVISGIVGVIVLGLLYWKFFMDTAPAPPPYYMPPPPPPPPAPAPAAGGDAGGGKLCCSLETQVNCFA